MLCATLKHDPANLNAKQPEIAQSHIRKNQTLCQYELPYSHVLSVFKID